MSGSSIRLFVSVPVACFRMSYAREYWETYPCPPPSTVYGMLLSAVGEEDRLVHSGAEIAVALLSRPERSVVLRTLWRIKDRKVGLGIGANARPDFQELLTGIQFYVWVRKGEEENGAGDTLAERLIRAFENPGNVSRFGGLALGESTHLVDEIRLWRKGDPSQGHLLCKDEKGRLTLPVWPDHVRAKGTRWERFSLLHHDNLPYTPEESAWVKIAPPEPEDGSHE